MLPQDSVYAIAGSLAGKGGGGREGVCITHMTMILHNHHSGVMGQMSRTAWSVGRETDSQELVRKTAVPSPPPAPHKITENKYSMLVGKYDGSL